MRFALFVLAVAMVSNEIVLRELTRAGVRQKAVAVGPTAFTEERVVLLSRAELARKPPVGFTQLYVYGPRGGAPLAKPAHITYEYWRGLFDSSSRSSNEIAEMVRVGRNAVLRMRDQTGKITRHVLEGQDPLLMEVQGDRFEILYFAFSAPGPYILQRVDAYVRTDTRLEVETGLELLRVLQPLFPEFELSVNVRNDSWFIYEPSYPFFNPFIDPSTPPTAQEYSKTRTLKCGRWSGSPSCRLE